MTDPFNDKARWQHDRCKDNVIGLALTLMMIVSLGFFGWYSWWLMR